MPAILRREPYNAALLNSPPLTVTLEQQLYIREILNLACSDSKFAEKAFVAIWAVLTQGNVVPPVVTSLSPSSVALGSPSFDIHVIGTGFTVNSKIMFNGYEEPTTMVSPTELTTGVNMPLWQAPATVPIAVLNGGVLSDPLMFSFTESVPEGLAQVANITKITPKEPVKKEK